jgi:hypothetical protein
MGSGTGFFEKCGDFYFKCRQVICDDTPDYGIIDPEIPVDDLVPECPHIPPRDILVLLFFESGTFFEASPITSIALLTAWAK